MSSAEIATTVKVMMAGIGYAGRGERLETLVGSCVGLVLWDRQRQVAGMAHVVLPESCGREGPAGKFADTAIGALKAGLAARGAGQHALVAKIAGGATMFGQRTDHDIGEQNYQAVRHHLHQHGISLVAEHIGGNQGRMLLFSPEDGSLAVHVARRLIATL